MVFSPDSRPATLFVSDGPEGTIEDLDLSRGELRERRRIRLPSEIARGLLSADGQALAIETTDGLVTLWDAQIGASRMRIRDLRGIDRNTSDGPDLRLMSWGDGTGVPTSGFNLIIFGADNDGALHIRMFDAHGNRVTDTDETKLPHSQSGAVSKLKQRLPGLLPPRVLTSDETAQVIAEVISIAGRTPAGHLSSDMAFSGDGSLLALAEPMSGAGLLWHIERGVQRRFAYPPSRTPEIRFLPGRADIVIKSEGRLILGNPVTGEFRPPREAGHRSDCRPAPSPDGQMLATGGEATIRLWDVGSLEVVASLLGHEREVTSLAWSPDGRLLSSHSQGDRTVRFWDIASRQEIGCIGDSGDGPDHILHLIFSPDGTTLAGYGGDPPEVILWPAPRDEADD
jgi:WD40 repeat protein